MSPRVGIDVHAVGRRQTGNETYIRSLVASMARQVPLGIDLLCYHTLPVDRSPALGWPTPIRRVWPHWAPLRILASFPCVLARDRVQLAHFQYVRPPLCPCPTVVTIHDISYEDHPEFFSRASRLRARALIPRSARAADHVLTVSEFSRQQIIERYRVPEDRVSVTYNGVSAAFRVIEDREGLAAVAARYGLRRPFVLALSNLQPRKNLERLVSAFQQLVLQRDFKHDLVLAGQPHWRASRIRRTIRGLGIEHRVVVTGYVAQEDLPALYNLADVFVYPSLYEGFGLPILEAMACGTPVVTSSVTAMPEVAGDAAVLVDPLEVAEIAEAISRILTDRSLYTRLVVGGMRRVQEFSWRTAAAETLAVYRRVLAERGEAAAELESGGTE